MMDGHKNVTGNRRSAGTVRSGVFLRIILISALAFSCGRSQEGVAAIKKANVLKIGIKTDVPGLGFYNKETQSFEGLEIEIAKLFAKEILGDASKIKLIPVTAMTRGQLIDEGDLDMAIATFSITDERKLRYHFSSPYYTDTFDILVKKGSDCIGIKDMDGKKIGVSMSTTAGTILEEAAVEKDCQPVIVEFETYIDIKRALIKGEIDAMAGNKSILKGYLDDNTILLDEEFSPQSYGVATKRTDREFAGFVEDCIRRWLSDGTILRLASVYHL